MPTAHKMSSVVKPCCSGRTLFSISTTRPRVSYPDVMTTIGDRLKDSGRNFARIWPQVLPPINHGSVLRKSVRPPAGDRS
jgi:hypothetical protein